MLMGYEDSSTLRIYGQTDPFSRPQDDRTRAIVALCADVTKRLAVTVMLPEERMDTAELSHTCRPIHHTTGAHGQCRAAELMDTYEEQCALAAVAPCESCFEFASCFQSSMISAATGCCPKRMIWKCPGGVVEYLERGSRTA